MKPAPGTPPKRADFLFAAILLGICLLTSLTQAVNCFTDDGWFQTQHRIIGHWPEADNYTPIAAPAYFHAATHGIAALLKLNLAQELYLASMLQSCMMFCALLFIHQALRQLQVSITLARWVTGGTAAYLLATLVTQAFWSENTMILLMAALACLVARQIGYASPSRARRTGVARNLMLALVLSIAAITRVVPLILLIPFALVMVHRSGLANTLRSMATIVPAAALLIALAMLANAMRFDRLELSNSTGRHLWQSIYPIAPQMLHDHPAYPALQAAYPQLHKQDWWSIVPQKIPGYEHHSQEAFLGELTLWAVKHHPGPWLRHGADKFFTMVLQPLPRIGLWYRVDPATNPLDRTTPLPPLLGGPLSDAWRATLDGAHTAFSRAHSALVLLPLLTLLFLPLREHTPPAWRAALAFYAAAFFLCIYFSLQIEVALDRYALPYAPFLAMMVGVGVQIIIHAVRAHRRRPKAAEGAKPLNPSISMQPAMPLVSVIIASYNHAPYVQDCLRSALSQGIDNLEILVTDDGSIDGTPGQVTALGDPRIRLNTFPQNQGACAAMNDAIRRSRGRYIAVLNSDDLFLRGKLLRQIDYLEKNPQIGAVFGWPSFIDDHGQPFDDAAHKDHAVFHQPNRSRHQWLRHFFDHGNALCHPTALVRREIYQTVGLYDPRLAQVPDLDQWIRVCMRYDIHVMPEPLTAFRIRSGQQNASAARPEVVRRDAWERADILHHYLDLSPAQLLQVFPEFTAQTSTTEQLACHALSLGTPFHQRFALQAWFDALPSGGLLGPPAPASAPAQAPADQHDLTTWQRYIAATAAANPHRIGG